MRATRPVRAVRILSASAASLLLAACPDPDPTEPRVEVETLRIVTETLPMGVVGEAYSAGVDAEGGAGAYSWSLASGALPAGLALSVDDLPDKDALITGIPEEAGTSSLVLQVTSEDGQTRTRSFTLQILAEPTPLGIETPALAPALVGARYETRLRAAGGDGQSFTWSVSGGMLPPGLTLTAAGVLSGTPTTPDTSIVVIRVESGAFDTEKAFTLQVVANRTATFDVTIAPITPVAAAIQPALDAAVNRWERAVTGDLQRADLPASFFSGADCGGFGTILNGTSADDVIILVNIRSIDGPGRTLGQAGPCVIRGNDLPFAGVLTLDADDLASLSPSATTDLIVHEIAHVLGFGSLWERFDLLTSSTSDPRFIGAAAVAQWNALGRSGAVPVENQGGEGTELAHWRESAFDEELMTGFAEMDGVHQPLSRVSIASLADLGYTVDLAAADAFAPAPPMSAAEATRDRANARGYDVVLRPTRRIEADGSVTDLRPEPR